MINVVLYEPEIPQNTGNIMRTCVATNSRLHLIEPMGFSIDEKHLKRSGMDYIQYLNVKQYKNWDEFKSLNKGKYVFITRYGNKPPSECNFSKIDDEIYIIFGKESTGIPKEILKNNFDDCYRLPMVSYARSLNLSNCVAIVVYEALRQLDYLDLYRCESIKGENYLLED
ncbi:MAG: tRNA (cytidine(34)-2'-O)-methyltransferase [Erysipelotrichaceae bacterium]|nr:tRNA (cytidine(34)-2'-O)-methyltransferase [Erysipelotrichaceae bacterium]